MDQHEIQHIEETMDKAVEPMDTVIEALQDDDLDLVLYSDDEDL